MTPPSSSSSSPTTTQACAACKYQRRKCAPDCILAPFFPHDRQRQFLNAHKLFGVSNITKIIKNLDPFDKQEAMRTIIFQSDVRSLDPVGGCYRIIRDLQRQIDYSRAELDIVLHHLTICKANAAAAAADSIDEREPDHVQFWGLQDSNHVDSCCSSLPVKETSVDEFDDMKIERSNDHLQQHHQLLKFESDDHELLHQSEAELLKMDSMMLKEGHDPIQQVEDQELKGAVTTLFTFPNCDTLA